MLAFLIWQFLSTILFNPFLIPPPLEVIRTAIPMLKSGEILDDVAISMTRVVVGFVTGSLAGIITGVLLGRFRVLHDLLDPILELLRYLSPTAMIPIAVIWFGIGELSKYFPDFLGHFFHRRHQYDCGRVAGTGRPPACSGVPGGQSTPDFCARRHPFHRSLHRDWNARGDGLFVHEHHPG